MNKTSIKEKAKAHWEYIKGILETHQENNEVIEKIGYHYKTAFLHGYKHGIEDKQKPTATELFLRRL